MQLFLAGWMIALIARQARASILEGAQVGVSTIIGLIRATENYAIDLIIQQQPCPPPPPDITAIPSASGDASRHCGATKQSRKSHLPWLTDRLA
jgi:hypothetical protein